MPGREIVLFRPAVNALRDTPDPGGGLSNVGAGVLYACQAPPTAALFAKLQCALLWGGSGAARAGRTCQGMGCAVKNNFPGSPLKPDLHGIFQQPANTLTPDGYPSTTLLTGAPCALNTLHHVVNGILKHDKRQPGFAGLI